MTTDPFPPHLSIDWYPNAKRALSRYCEDGDRLPCFVARQCRPGIIGLGGCSQELFDAALGALKSEKGAAFLAAHTVRGTSAKNWRSWISLHD